MCLGISSELKVLKRQEQGKDRQGNRQGKAAAVIYLCLHAGILKKGPGPDPLRLVGYLRIKALAPIPSLSCELCAVT